MADDIVWRLINKGFCSNKVRLINKDFCRDENNVTGLCTKTSCPLANSRYATVREHDGLCYLYIKTVERTNNPAKMWEKIPLSKSYGEALKQIAGHLKWWPKRSILTCKLRLTRIRQTWIRMRRMALRSQRETVVINKKVERREVNRLKKAEIAARIESQIKKELYQRLLKGTYPTDMFNLHKCFKTLLDEQGVAEPEKLKNRNTEEELEVEDQMDAEAQEDDEEAPRARHARGPTTFVAADDDDDDAEGRRGGKRSSGSGSGDIEDIVPGASKRARRPARRPRVSFAEVEVEHETEAAQQSSAN
eukprot:m51a1_g7146 hypothetical protein (305) ;mRNA; f:317977-319320